VVTLKTKAKTVVMIIFFTQQFLSQELSAAVALRMNQNKQATLNM